MKKRNFIKLCFKLPALISLSCLSLLSFNNYKKKLYKKKFSKIWVLDINDS